jgi:acyl-[acyl-carrier-protein]-phospholipid O-acyltransferase/long-chain-fatty-acid--[acyl-carrier-protein] ligase
MEGYGVSEASPIVAVNTAIYFRSGSVGRPLPGIRTRVEKVPGIAKGGRLWIKGANVMMGYMRRERPGVLEPLPDGWYDTGDIVYIDEDGFIYILGRAKRFAKIAGEMISLTSLEEEITKLFPGKLHAVVTLSDKKRGESLALLTEDPSLTRELLIQELRKKQYPEAASPRRVLCVEKMPLLGSGKINYVQIAEDMIDRAEESDESDESEDR